MICCDDPWHWFCIANILSYTTPSKVVVDIHYIAHNFSIYRVASTIIVADIADVTYTGIFMKRWEELDYKSERQTVICDIDTYAIFECIRNVHVSLSDKTAFLSHFRTNFKFDDTKLLRIDQRNGSAATYAPYETPKALHYWPFIGQSTSHRWISLTKGQ